jgi:hypothetical protein
MEEVAAVSTADCPASPADLDETGGTRISMMFLSQPRRRSELISTSLETTICPTLNTTINTDDQNGRFRHDRIEEQMSEPKDNMDCVNRSMNLDDSMIDSNETLDREIVCELNGLGTQCTEMNKLATSHMTGASMILLNMNNDHQIGLNCHEASTDISATAN